MQAYIGQWVPNIILPLKKARIIAETMGFCISICHLNNINFEYEYLLFFSFCGESTWLKNILKSNMLYKKKYFKLFGRTFLAQAMMQKLPFLCVFKVSTRPGITDTLI